MRIYDYLCKKIKFRKVIEFLETLYKVYFIVSSILCRPCKSVHLGASKLRRGESTYQAGHIRL